MADAKPVRTIHDIPGWFSWTDQQMFRHLLGPAAPDEPGDLVELGVYLGKSAAFMGEFQRPGERFVVCDLFNGESDTSNKIENARSYRNLTREEFENNYRAVRGGLPEIVQGLSSTITEHVKPGSARFVHIDASHLYEHVVIDIESALTMLGPGGVAVFDDFRHPHTPGVAAAVWAAVGAGRLHPFCLTESKLYAVAGDPNSVRDGLQAWLIKFGRLLWESQWIAGYEVLRVAPPRSSPPATTAELEELIRGMGKKLTRLEKQVASLNRQLAQSLPRRVQKSVLRRVAALRNQR